jgi:hypothetical protein
MKYTRWLLGKFPSPKMRRPLRDLSESEANSIRKNLEELGYKCVQ